MMSGRLCMGCDDLSKGEILLTRPVVMKESIQRAYDLINKDLNGLSGGAEQYALKLNPSKSQVMVFRSGSSGGLDGIRVTVERVDVPRGNKV
ncbi:hypothetical protein HHI36_019840 [Cryptolaemus montrouzieri]|uniref:Uncharacterized protein n=1 Tax=Cryptolaemus montrouzieri TaxID=559131 RepID=A0ABD2N8I9_9CUCU